MSITNFGDPNYMIQLHSSERIVAVVAKGGGERKLQHASWLPNHKLYNNRGERS
jgi:hypothetical protein